MTAFARSAPARLAAAALVAALAWAAVAAALARDPRPATPQAAQAGAIRRIELTLEATGEVRAWAVSRDGLGLPASATGPRSWRGVVEAPAGPSDLLVEAACSAGPAALRIRLGGSERFAWSSDGAFVELVPLP